MKDTKSYIVELIKRVEGKEPDAKGGNKQCYYIDGYALLKDPGIDSDKLRQLVELQKELKEKGINICTTLGFVTSKKDRDREIKRGYVLQEKAGGKPIHKSDIKLWSKTDEEIEQIRNEYLDELGKLKGESQKFYDKFVSDWIEIKKHGLKIDPKKTGNFYYEEGKNINFIDLDLEKTKNGNIDLNMVCYEMATVLADGIKYNDSRIVLKNDVKKNVNSALSQIFKKMSNSLEKHGMSKEEIAEIIKSRFPEIDIDTKDWREQAQEQTIGKSQAQIEREQKDKEAESRSQMQSKNKMLTQTYQSTKIRQEDINNSFQTVQQTKNEQEQQKNKNTLDSKRARFSMSPEQRRLNEQNQRYTNQMQVEQTQNDTGKRRSLGQGMGR